MRLRAKWVLPVDAPPIENGVVEVTGDTITAVGKQSGPSRDLGDVVLLPGLINAHCHFDYTHLPVPYRGSFTDWIRDIVVLKATQTPGDFLAGIQAGMELALRAGTTTVVNIECFPELIAQLPATPLRVVWCPELIDLARRVELPAGFKGLSPHAPYTASAELYRRCAQSGRFITTHVAESDEEDEMFRQGRGQLYDALQQRGRNMSDCGRAGAVDLLHSYGVLSRNCLAAHANCLTSDDVQLMAQTGTSVVHCPKTHRYFQRSPAPLTALLDAGVNVCLGTDSLASNDTLDIFAEMQEMARVFPEWPPARIIAMATTNAAKALSQSTRLGKIATGAVADLIAVPANGYADPYAAVVFAEKTIAFMMLNGKVVCPT